MGAENGKVGKPPVVPSRLKKTISPETNATVTATDGDCTTVYVGSTTTTNDKVSVMNNSVFANGLAEGYMTTNSGGGSINCSPKLSRGCYNGNATHEERERFSHTSPLATRKNGYVMNGSIHRNDFGSSGESSNYDHDSLDGSDMVRLFLLLMAPN